jgi:serine/threonine protein phosphatase 1
MVADPLNLPAPGWLSPGKRVYAIGDVHGCDSQLAALHRLIGNDLARRPIAHPLLVHLGDYVDRGLDSAGAVRRLAAGSVLPGCPMVCLRGNHEQMLLGAMTGDPARVEDWLMNGAAATLRSWGVTPQHTPREWMLAMTRELPFLIGLSRYHQVDGYVFVHAGLRPGVALAKQVDQDLLWIREDFLDWTGPILPEAPGTAVVHGHTPTRLPQVTGRRVGVDTGAVAGRALTCAVLEGRGVSFLAA